MSCNRSKKKKNDYTTQILQAKKQKFSVAYCKLTMMKSESNLTILKAKIPRVGPREQSNNLFIYIIVSFHKESLREFIYYMCIYSIKSIHTRLFI